ncbi:hypothetical protein GE09DRAFT_690361 [Coniochaeta sp. 2T2.1]|nr:hypothetical protein GE09DRAFT_690361 [Coniochaeta sp. 2T2.1]
MMSSLWFTLVVSLLSGAVAFIPPVSTKNVRAFDFCPDRCADAGPSTGNWSVYPNLKTIKRCQQTMFLGFSLHDPVDDPDTNHRVQACSSFGADFYNMAPSSSAGVAAASSLNPANSVDVELELGWWDEGFGLAEAGIYSLVQQMREYIDHGHGETDRPFILYGRSGQATIGLYIGQGLLNQGISDSALRIFGDNFDALNATTPSLAMQLCDPHSDSTHVFGVAVSSNGTFAPIQDAIRSWANATCLAFHGSRSFPAKATLTTPLLTGNGTSAVGPWTNSTGPQTNGTLQARAECSTVQVISGDGCAQLAERCKITAAKFTEYNPGICATLKPKQRVCCSSGTLPDFRPKPKANGSCFSYQVVQDDNCANLGAEYSLTIPEIESFNTNTWGWAGCNLLFKGAIMCLSTGAPPFPAAIPNAVCGPQKPNSTPPSDANAKITDMNPCPLNACCNIWGQCGITRDFCIDTNTGPPGTAKTGTYGCISNCGLDVVKGSGTGAIKLAYFQGYGMGRACLYQDALQIDTSKYTHLHFGFGTLAPSTYEVHVGDMLASYQFTQFQLIRNAKRILSFGGWSFSTDPATYLIFRDGVKPANRLKMATSIANFIKSNDLDGVDIDWEYPGAPDLPTFDPGKAEDGPNYLAFLVVLKNLLPGKTVAIAAPASYYYLKQFPIKEISRVVDYIVYMTYDLHGQWDTGSKYTQEGCEEGNCLRSQVNLTETRQALAMITKAGVPAAKVVVGVTSYGRSFAMEQPGCWGPACKFTGTRAESHATPGRCTGTGGYLADAEIGEIISGVAGGKRRASRVVTTFLDAGSNSDIVVYDNNQWVAYMSPSTKLVRQKLYTSYGMAGTTDWASDLQTFNPPPKPYTEWGSFIARAAVGSNPKEDTNTSIGNWKTFDCTADAIADWSNAKLTPSDRWKAMDSDSAWSEVTKKWFDTDKDNFLTFEKSVGLTLKQASGTGCSLFNAQDHCDGATECEPGLNGPLSGPAAKFIWESLIQIHSMYHSYWTALGTVTGVYALKSDHMETTFAPIPEAKTNQWLNILIDILTIGTLTVAGPFFNGMIKQLPAFAAEKTFNNAKDTTMNLIGQSTTLAKDWLQSPNQDEWTPALQDKFSSTMGEVIFGWRAVAEEALSKLFDGSPESVKILGAAMADGQLIDGIRTQPPPTPRSGTALQLDALRSIYGFAIPALWRRSKTYAFVIDSGEGCDGHPLGKYVADDVADKTGVCFEGRRYYLVHPDGDAHPCPCEIVGDHGPCQTRCYDNKFSMPVGLESLGDFNITKEDLVIGSVQTWNKAGQKNGVTIDPVAAGATLLDMGVTTPGFVNLPVCSPDRAFQSWKTTGKGSSANYPCDIPPGIGHCGDSNFENRGGSAKGADCLQIIRNIEADGSTEWSQGITGQREILSFGSCHFGIERTGGTGGAVMFKVGGQDVIDIINEAVKQFGQGDTFGARGTMSCDGTTAGTHVNVMWGIYGT